MNKWLECMLEQSSVESNKKLPDCPFCNASEDLMLWIIERFGMMYTSICAFCIWKNPIGCYEEGKLAWRSYRDYFEIDYSRIYDE